MRFTKVLLLGFILSLTSCTAVARLDGAFDEAGLDEANSGKIIQREAAKATIHKLKNGEWEELGKLRKVTRIPPGKYALSVHFMDPDVGFSEKSSPIDVRIEAGKTYVLTTTYSLQGGGVFKWRPEFREGGTPRFFEKAFNF